ncbi:MAG: peptidylprolyl isomerase [Vicinamibacterales bacterium]|nr:peptidylprolyl isomerase [Vicinamibacterales bacterium]
MRVTPLVLWLALAAAGPATAQSRAPQPQPLPLTFEQKMAWMLQLEDQRVLRAPAPPPAQPEPAPARGRRTRTAPPPPPPVPDLVALSSDAEGRVRRRAALAIGRVGLAEGVAPLAALLAGDRDAEVRQMAAFGMGLIGDRSAVDPLRAALRDADPLVQGRAAEALGSIGDAASAPAIAAMASAHVPALNAASLEPDEGAYPLDAPAEAFRLGLYALTRLKAADPLAGVALDGAGLPRVAWWPVAYALSRTDDARFVPALTAMLRSRSGVSRAFAARGLGSRKAAASQGALVPLARAWRADPRTAVAAIRALAQTGGPDAAAPIREIAQARDADPNLRLEAVTALGALRDHESLDLVLDAVTDPWPSMRASALRALRDIDLDTFVIVLSGLDPDPHVSVRTTVVSLLPSLGAALARPRLAALLAGQDPAVTAAAIAAISGMQEKPPDFADTLLRLVAGGDVLVRAAAAEALGVLKPQGGAQALAAAYTAGLADELYQARAAAIAAIARYGGAAYLETDRGEVEIELLVLDAPLTCESFLALARRGYFSGMAIHRVVPNFVVQAGDRRGDGEGGPGYTLRDEINMQPYVRGAVGMALDGADTGGSQFFVTHSPQPHLDGRYTVFGRVVAGMEVVDRLRQGDEIRRVRVWDGVELVVR